LLAVKRLIWHSLEQSVSVLEIIEMTLSSLVFD